MPVNTPATALPGLCIKPSLLPYESKTLFSVDLSAPAGTLTLRSLHLTRDLDYIHDWVNRPYSRRFWQMDGSRALLKTTYAAILEHPHAHSFMALFNHVPVSQIEAYQVLTDELRVHVDAGPYDCGIHLLMCPPDQLQRGLTVQVLKSFITFYFSHSLAGDLYAEPDTKNAMANLLAKRVGFRFVRSIDLSYKTANLYQLTRKEWRDIV